MSIGFRVLGSILVMKSVSQCNPQIYNEPQARFQIPLKEDPDYLTKRVELQSVVNPVLKLKSDEKSDEKEAALSQIHGRPYVDMSSGTRILDGEMSRVASQLSHAALHVTQTTGSAASLSHVTPADGDLKNLHRRVTLVSSFHS